MVVADPGFDENCILIIVFEIHVVVVDDDGLVDVSSEQGEVLGMEGESRAC